MLLHYSNFDPLDRTYYGIERGIFLFCFFTQPARVFFICQQASRKDNDHIETREV